MVTKKISRSALRISVMRVRNNTECSVGIKTVETVSVLISMNYEPQQWPQKVEISSPKSNYLRPCPESHNKIP